MELPVPYYREFLQKQLEERVKRNPRYSLRSFAAALGVEPSALSKILSGKRMLTKKMAERFSRVIELSPEERQKLLLSAAIAKSDVWSKPNPSGLLKLIEVRPLATVQDLNADIFTAISEWYYYAILELTLVEGFQANARWISTQLKISHSAAQIAIDRLIKLGLLTVAKNGRWKKTTQWVETEDKTVTSGAHRKRQKQLLEKSIEALENTPIQRRNHSSVTLPIDSKKIPEAKKMIQEFSQKLGAYLSTGKTDSVYELSVQMFPLTKDEL
jgi:uncharacterized protein (TIGR02147 family)